MSRAELKSQAKEQIKGKIGLLFIIFLIIWVIMFAVAFVPLVGAIVMWVLQVGFGMGIVMIYLALTKKENVEIGDMFKGFNILGKALWLNIITNFFVFLWSLLLFIPGYIKSIAYSMAPYILAENPTMTAREALSKSKEMMNGHKLDYFILSLSFIGWYLLVGITFGLVGIYVIPYMNATITNFYNSIKE